MLSISNVSYLGALLGGSPPEDPQIWSKELSCIQLPTLWVSAFYVKPLKMTLFSAHVLRGALWCGA